MCLYLCVCVCVCVHRMVCNKIRHERKVPGFRVNQNGPTTESSVDIELVSQIILG